MRTLIDTNVLIALEDDHILESRFSDFIREASKNSEIMVHPASLLDIDRDRDRIRKITIKSRLSKYQILEKPPEPDPNFIAIIGQIKKPNDEVDAALLYSVYRDSVNFLVTEDIGIHKKARQIGVHERILNVNQAVSLFYQLGFREIPEHTLIQSIPVHNLEINDRFFDSLREDYDGKKFNEWFKKICQEGRDCWALLEDDKILALTIYKEEFESADSSKIPTPTLKLSTFKVSDEISGKKIGELMLKLSFWYSIKNHLKSIYLTAYPDKGYLINVLDDFGFHKIDKKGNEDILMKLMIPPEASDSDFSTLQYAIDYYPNFKDGSYINKFIIPIQPQFHDKLFPDVKGRQRTIAEYTSPIPEGNTIKKAYLCNSRTKQITEGDLILFYRSQDRQEITSIGIVERTVNTKNISKIISNVSNRTVYSINEISTLAKKDVLVIIFRHQGNYNRPISLSTLQDEINIKGPIQTIRKISHDDYLRIKQEGNGCW